MPQLRVYAAAGCVHRVGDAAPAGDLRRRAEAGRAGIALAHGRDIGAFAHDQACAGALCIVVGHQGIGGVARLRGARARHRRHDDAVGQGQAAQGQRFKQGIACLHGGSLPGVRYGNAAGPLARFRARSRRAAWRCGAGAGRCAGLPRHARRATLRPAHGGRPARRSGTGAAARRGRRPGPGG
ncbi:hypothetical protein D3C71_1323730 [compost metagenome]